MLRTTSRSKLYDRGVTAPLAATAARPAPGAASGSGSITAGRPHQVLENGTPIAVWRDGIPTGQARGLEAHGALGKAAVE
jgi:hypothetical protein